MLPRQINIAAVLLILGMTTPAYAQNATTQGNLMRWLAQEAAPEMTRILGQHPKFKGQRIRFTPVLHGQPVAQSNKLIDTITQ